MRPLSVVVLAEVFDDDAGLGEGPELFAVEALIAEATVEAFDEPIFPRAGRGDVDGLDGLLRQPLLEFLRDKLWAIVGADELRRAVFGDGRSHQPDDVGRADLALGPQDMDFLGVFIEDGKHPQGAAMHRGIGDKVPGPDMAAMVRLRRQPGGGTSAGHITPGRGDPQAFGPPKFLHLLAAHRVAGLPQLYHDPAEAEAGILA